MRSDLFAELSRHLRAVRSRARVGVHVATFGGKAAWKSEEPVSSVHGGPAGGCWSEQERVVLRLADQLHASSGVDDELWQQAASVFAPEQLVELVMLGGAYHSVSCMVNAFGVQLEESAPRFPRAA